MISRPLLLVLLIATTVRADEPDGAALFTLNCAACHQLDQALVGPSLAEIRDLYTGKPDDFVKWSIAPQKKRPTAIEMPSMAHLGAPALLKIHAHILKTAEGVTAKKEQKGDPFATSPTQALRPLVQRIFLPDASPAAIAVALDSRVSLCWDAGPCRLRYAWTDGFIDGYPYWSGNGSSLAKILGRVRYTESTPLLAGTPKFGGYELDRDGFPTFLYRLGTTSVRESFRPLEGKTGFQRHIQLSPPPSQPLALEFPGEPEKTGISSSSGTWSGSTLTLSPSAAAGFTLTHVFP